MQLRKFSTNKLNRRLSISMSRLKRYEARAMRTHMDALRERAAVAAQAGDFNTLISDQIDLLPQTNARLRAHAAGLLAIAKLSLLEIVALGRGCWQSVKSVATRC